MTVTVVQGKSIVAQSASNSLTLGVAPTNGNLLVAMMYFRQADAFNNNTIQSGWTAAKPYYALPTTDTVWSSGPWGEGAIAYKVAGAGEPALQTPYVTAASQCFCMTIFEVSGLSGSWLSLYRQKYDPAHTGYADTGGDNLSGHSLPYGVDVAEWQTASTETVLLLSSWVYFDGTYPVITGYDNAITPVTGTIAGEFPLDATQHTATVSAFWHSMGTSATKTPTVTKSGSTYGSLTMVGLSAAGGGGGIIDPITATVISPAVTASVFKYTTIL